jgi:hypothetical protein
VNSHVIDPKEDVRVNLEAWDRSELAYLYGRSGQTAQARQALIRLEQLERRQPMDPAVFVLSHIGMGNKDQAFAWMNKAYAQHSSALATLKVDPIFDPLRGDPRFHEFERRVGLAQ